MVTCIHSLILIEIECIRVEDKEVIIMPNKIFDPIEWGVSPSDEKIIKLIVELEKERKKRNFSQATVANIANISQGQLSRIENLESIPSLDTINKIAGALNKQLQLVSI